MRRIFFALFLMTLLSSATESYAKEYKFDAKRPERGVKKFRNFIAKYNKQALEHVWSMDLDKIFCSVDSKYEFRPREAHYLFEFDMPVALEMRKQFIASYFLKTGDSALDIGAYLGTYSFFYNFLVTNKGCVMAFEPSPAAFYPLQEMLRQRGNLNILLQQKAISTTAGQKLVMEIHPGTLYQNSTLESALMNRTSGSNALIEVETESLDHIFESGDASIQCLKLIKIDSEGHETAILEGGKKLIHFLRPIIIFEYGVDPGIFEPRSIEILEGLGYVCYDLMYMNLVHPGYQHLTGTDLLAVPSEKLEEFERHVKPLLIAIKDR